MSPTPTTRSGTLEALCVVRNGSDMVAAMLQNFMWLPVCCRLIEEGEEKGAGGERKRRKEMKQRNTSTKTKAMKEKRKQERKTVEEEEEGEEKQEQSKTTRIRQLHAWSHDN